MKMSNRWNRIIYQLWSPIYDQTIGRFFLPGRRRALEILNLIPGERLLLVGAGTGADLPLLPEGVDIVGVDLSSEMLARAHSKLPLPGRSVMFIQGDAQRLLVEQAAYDAVVFNLVLSVIPDGRTCLHENLRALKPGGRAVVFDKFAPENEYVPIGRRILNIFSTLFGTDITRKFGEMLSDSGAVVVWQEASILRGKYQIFLLKKN